jgi:hypothetical protein
VVNIEAGRQHFPFDALYRFADAVGVEPAHLLPARTVEAIAPQRLRRLGLRRDESAWVNRVVSTANSEPGSSAEEDGSDVET